MEGRIVVTKKEIHRAHVFEQVVQRTITLKEKAGFPRVLKWLVIWNSRVDPRPAKEPLPVRLRLLQKSIVPWKNALAIPFIKQPSIKYSSATHGGNWSQEPSTFRKMSKSKTASKKIS